MSDTEEKLKQARALLEAEKAEEGRMVLLELLKGELDNTAALLMLGGSYFYDKKYAESGLVYEKLIEAEPGSGMLSIAFFNSLWNQGLLEEAADEIRRFISVADKVRERETIERYAEVLQTLTSQKP